MEDNHDKHEAAYEAMCKAMHTVEDVMSLLDRHWGDSGTDPAMILQWVDQLRDLAFDIRESLGEPRMRLPNGGLVPRPENL
jgi:hypothetical protein